MGALRIRSFVAIFILLLTGVGLFQGDFVRRACAGLSCDANIIPPFLGQQSTPLVMLVLSQDHKLYYEAYNDASDINGDGKLDTTYDHSIDYYGYFDPYKCYAYHDESGQDNDYFYPVATTTDKFCSSGQFSGNIMNWMTMSRIDAMRKVLYGGYRDVDTTSETILERGFVPQDAHSWGKEYTGRLCFDSSSGTYGNMCMTPDDCDTGQSCVDKSEELLGIAAPQAPTGGGTIAPVQAKACDGVNPCRFAVVKYNNRFDAYGTNHEDLISDFNTSQVDSSYPEYVDQVLNVSGSTDSNFSNANDYTLLVITYFYVSPDDDDDTWYFAVDSDDAGEVEIDGIPVVGWYNGHAVCHCQLHNSAWTPSVGWHKFIARLGEAWGGDRISVYYKKRYSDSWSVFGSDADMQFKAPLIPYPAPDWVKNGCFVRYGVGIDDSALAPYDNTINCPYTGGQRHLYCSVNMANDGPPLLREVRNRSERIWVWATKESPVCDSPGQSGYPFGSVTPKDYTIRVKVCDPAFPEENCKAYPGPDGVEGTSDDILKPTGLLQKYGESGRMYFGLLTGSYEKNYSGGVLRKEIGPITDEIDQNTGIFSGVSGIIDTINNLRVVNFNYGSHSYACGWVTSGAPGEGLCEMWGNPVGEMMYETLRYFEGKDQATPAFFSNTGFDASLPAIRYWDPPYDTYPYCSQAVMLVISDINPSYDTDQLPGAAFSPAHGSSSNLGDEISGMDVAALADTIGTDEGYVNTDVFIGQSGSDFDSSCTAKGITGFGEIRGLCPEEPTKEGGYTSAAVAWYGHTTDLLPGDSAPGRQDVLTYTVGLASPLPQIVIKLGTAGHPKYIKMVPYGKSVGGCLGVWSHCRGGSGDYCPTNQIVDFYVTELGPTHGQFRVNFEDVEQGADHDMDAVAIYDYEVLNENEVKISLSSEYASGCIDQVLGFIISGTNGEDGVWLPIRDLDSAGPGSCSCNTGNPVASGGMADSDTPCSVSCRPLNWTHTFTVGDSSATLMKNPLWYAAKWGGFVDADSSGPGLDKPDKDFEWDADSDGVPDTYFYVTNAGRLEEQLDKAFQSILTRASAGSAASVVSASRSGEGALYQAMFWPKVVGDEGKEVKWIGDVHGLLMDIYGRTYEDTNSNAALDSADQKLVIYYDKNSSRTRACFGQLNEEGVCSGLSKELDDVHFIWSAADWLNKIPDTDIETNRVDYISSENKRYIFTWIDEDDDGVVDSSTEVKSFDAPDLEAATFSSGLAPLYAVMDTASNQDMAKLVNWVRGEEYTDLRSRMKDGRPWRLGDVIHSTPVAVSAPAENYNFLYNDVSYSTFKHRWRNRRQVVYFGGNDGMLHAVNGGFYKRSSHRFCRSPNCDNEGAYPELGAELWAYVPYNVLPHLHCLADPSYEHRYFVDLKPRIFDVQIFENDDVHPGGWGTILVAGMRFGGEKMRPGELDPDGDGSPDYPSDPREFTSSYFILDITDPENPPVLLGEFTRHSGSSEVDLGYTTGIPTVVPMKDSTGATAWYLVFGSGPTDLNGSSSQNARLCVMPLSWFTDGNRAFRLPDAVPTAGPTYPEGGCFELPDPDSFVGNPVTIDMDLKENYKADAVYFGTVSGVPGDWGGKMYRLVTRKVDSDGEQVVTYPDEWATLLSSDGSKPNPAELIDAGRPVTAPAAVGTDGYYYWVFFGTGRFFTPFNGQNFANSDKEDASTQFYYGIKEPMDCDGTFTWETVEKTGTPNSTPGDQGLVRVDQILVQHNVSPFLASLSCTDGSSDCLPDGVSTFLDLVNYIDGTNCDTGGTGTDGWYRQLPLERERNLGQATLFGGLLTFTTYQPFEDPCMPEGISYLYGLYYLTGTPWHKAVFGESDEIGKGVDSLGNVIGTLGLGRGLASTPNLHTGSEKGAKAYVQTSTGEIVEVQAPNLPLEEKRNNKDNWHEQQD